MAADSRGNGGDMFEWWRRTSARWVDDGRVWILVRLLFKHVHLFCWMDSDGASLLLYSPAGWPMVVGDFDHSQYSMPTDCLKFDADACLLIRFWC